jgi:hypothetical protein
MWRVRRGCDVAFCMYTAIQKENTRLVTYYFAEMTVYMLNNFVFVEVWTEFKFKHDHNYIFSM